MPEDGPCITGRSKRARNRRRRPLILLRGGEAVAGALDGSAAAVQHVGVDLGRSNVLVAEQFLHRPDVVAVLKQVGAFNGTNSH